MVLPVSQTSTNDGAIHRSAIFQPLLGQPQAVELLSRAVQQQRIAPAYLFVGAEGVGKRLAVRCWLELLLAKADAEPQSLRHRIQHGNHPDLLWVEPTFLHQGKRIPASQAAEAGVKRRSPPQIRLEQIREVTQFLSRPPLEAPRSVVVLEQAETMADAAANGLLKTLEEPGTATLILLAPSIESLLPTLVSRCQRIPFQRLNSSAIATILAQTDFADLLQHPEILELAQGSPGEAIAHWQQLQAMPPDLLNELAHPPTSLKQALEMGRQIAHALEPESQLWLVDYLQNRYWQSDRQSQFLHHLEHAKRCLRSYVQPRLVWEVTLMQLCQVNR